MFTKKRSLIVFCGMDGTGKTSLAERLAKYLEREDIPVELMHAHSYSISQNSFAFSDARVRSLKSVLWLVLPIAFLDNLFTFYFKYCPVLKRKSLICDRYFYDKIARMLYYGICNNWMAKLYLRLLPRPDFVFFLDVEPKRAYLRKGEYDENGLSQFRQAYSFISAYLNAPVINTNVSIEVSQEEVLAYLK